MKRHLRAVIAGVIVGLVALGSALALAAPALLAAYLDRVQIPAEERALRARFGADFDAYTRRVGRWLGPGARRGSPAEGGKTSR